MKAKTLVSCLVTGSWLLACGSEPPPDEPTDPSGPEDDVVVIATAEAVTSAAAAATNGAGGADAGSASASSSGGSGDPAASAGNGDPAGSAATGEPAAGGAGSSGGAATDTGITGEPAGGAAGAAGGGPTNGSGAAADSDTGTDTSGSSGATGGTGSSGAAGSAGTSSATGEPPPPPPLPLGAVLITEYVEGSDGDDKAVELSNVSDETASLAECRLETYFNGNLESTSGVDLTTIELPPQTSYVLCKSNARSALSSLCDRNAPSINFNGDDALVLRCNGIVHDSFGQVGFDPGDEWRSPEGSRGTADHVLRRHCGAAARTDPLAPFEEALGEDWVSVWAFDDGTNDEFKGLGLAACAASESGDASGTDAGNTDAGSTDSGDGTGGAASE